GPDGAPDGVEIHEVDEFDAFFGDGSDLMDIDLPQDSALSRDEAECLRKFDDALRALSYDTCVCCHEIGFDMDIIDEVCGRCRKDVPGNDDNNDEPHVRKWSDRNNVNPLLVVPPELQNLTLIEQMLISPVKCIAQVRYTRG
ncbi:hypothetical protein FISHEDRAFT_20904, partial [Fistulina hepatica ATCC 64428]